MEYTQLTINDWIEMKQKLKLELQGVKHSFVRIGYALRRIEDGKYYEQDGYKSVAAFAKAEYGLEASTTSRFIAINKEYSVDGYSEVLRPEYADLGRSQLEEMLKLPESDRQMIQAETARADIRELKRFNKTEPAAGVADDVHHLVEQFYKDNPDTLNAVFSETGADTKKLAEIINPSGNRSYRKGLFFLMMYENRITVKKFGDAPQDMTWEAFIELTKDIFGESADGKNTWSRYFGEEVPKNTGENERSTEIGQEKTKDNVTPAQKTPKSLKNQEAEDFLAAIDRLEQKTSSAAVEKSPKSLKILKEEGSCEGGNNPEKTTENDAPAAVGSTKNGSETPETGNMGSSKTPESLKILKEEGISSTENESMEKTSSAAVEKSPKSLKILKAEAPEGSVRESGSGEGPQATAEDEQEAPEDEQAAAVGSRGTESSQTAPEGEQAAAVGEQETGSSRAASEDEQEVPEDEQAAAVGSQEAAVETIIGERPKTRKDYMEALTPAEMALYITKEFIAREYKAYGMRINLQITANRLTRWLLKEVDENGTEAK